MNRRNFIKLCAVTGTYVSVTPSIFNQKLYAHDGRVYEAYEKVLLTDENNKPIKASNLKKDEVYVFKYPHKGTPCFLLNVGEKCNTGVKLKTSEGEEYLWEEGCGKNNSIVAYSAICSHSLTHPTKSESFITYVPKDKKTVGVAGAIVCSSHISSFDPKQGGKVLGGPADQPIASIVLEHNSKDDTLSAVGVLGGDKFHDYFKAFKTEMKKEFGNKRKAKKLVKVSVPTVALTKYTQEIIQY